MFLTLDTLNIFVNSRTKSTDIDSSTINWRSSQYPFTTRSSNRARKKFDQDRWFNTFCISSFGSIKYDFLVKIYNLS